MEDFDRMIEMYERSLKANEKIIDDNLDMEMEGIISENEFKKRVHETRESNINELLENEQYENGTPIELDRATFDEAFLDYFSEIAAVDLISTKNIDVFISDEKYNFDKVQSFYFNDLIKQNFLEMKMKTLAKKVALSGIGALWFEPIFPPNATSKVKEYSLNSDVQIIQCKYINNEIQAASFLVNLVRGISVGNVYAMVYADKWKYQTSFYSLPSGTTWKDLKNESDKDKYFMTQEEVEKTLEEHQSDLIANYENIRAMIIYLNQEHDLGFVPLFPLFFNEDYVPLIRNYQQDFDELFALAQKAYDEAQFLGTKVKWLNANPDESTENKKQLMKYRKILASSAGLFANNDFSNDNVQVAVDLVTKMPIWEPIFNSVKQKINFILKKIGISSDTDSKGSVQQSLGEIIRQNEFSYNQQNYRNVILQNYLRNLLRKFYFANTRDETKHVSVISTQSLGMSEMEKLNYVIMAKSNGLIDEARAISILNGTDYVDSMQLVEIQKLKEMRQEIEQKGEILINEKQE